MRTFCQDQAIHIVGIELRTDNQEAFRTIPAHWARFASDTVAARIGDKLSDDVYAVYTNFQNAGRNNSGVYSLVLGASVAPDAKVPEGMVRAVIPASWRAVFPVAKSRFDLVGPAWEEIWRCHDLRKTFIADFEHYRADGQIDVLVGIDEELVPA